MLERLLNRRKPSSNRCGAKTLSGERCRSWAMAGSKLCSIHAGVIGDPRELGKRSARARGFIPRDEREGMYVETRIGGRLVDVRPLQRSARWSPRELERRLEVARDFRSPVPAERSETTGGHVQDVPGPVGAPDGFLLEPPASADGTPVAPLPDPLPKPPGWFERQQVEAIREQRRTMGLPTSSRGDPYDVDAAYEEEDERHRRELEVRRELGLIRNLPEDDRVA